MKIDLLATPPSAEEIDDELGTALDKWALIERVYNVLLLVASISPLAFLFPIINWVAIALPMLIGFDIWMSHVGFKLRKPGRLLLRLGQVAAVCYLMNAFPGELFANSLLILGGLGLSRVVHIWSTHHIDLLRVARKEAIHDLLFRTNHIRDPLLFTYYSAVKKAHRNLIVAELNAMKKFINKTKSSSLMA
jgi:hypothetical protein